MNETEQRRIHGQGLERQWLTYREAQLIAGLGRTKLWQLIAAGDLSAAKVGRSVRINRQSLDGYMERNRYVVADR